jgi:hypothetical protein
MPPLAPGAVAPPIPGPGLEARPRAVFFYKVTCPICQLAAPQVQRIEDGNPGSVLGIGQDPADRLDAFAAEHGVTFRSLSESPPYGVSTAYGIRTVPTTFLVGREGTILRTVEAWDRDGLNGLSRHLSDLTGRPYAPVSDSDDGLPPFRPG